MHNHVLAPGFLQLSPWKTSFFTEKPLNLVLAISFRPSSVLSVLGVHTTVFSSPSVLEPCFGCILCVLAPFPPIQVALGSYQLKLRVSANVEHVLCFIIYLNVKYD
jgi:hypothetical protein